MSVFTLPIIEPVDKNLRLGLQQQMDGKAKPPGSLGRMEDLAVQIGSIQNRPDPKAQGVLLDVFAGDHGLTQEGVSAYPANITAAMVTLFLTGKSCVSAFAYASDCALRVVDAGVNADLPDHPDLLARKIRKGTGNAALEPALTLDEVDQALSRGCEIGSNLAASVDIYAVGEMGIGNSSSAALIMHRLAPAPLDSCIGQGTGHDQTGMVRKRAALERCAARTKPDDPISVLSEFGGAEIAMMAGSILGAASTRRIIVIDGFIATSAALAAIRLSPNVLDYCIFSHCSAEHGHQRLLSTLGVRPLLSLDMRLGEGTGAVLAVPLIRAAARLFSHVANLADILPG
jgi:nicotinate-nucleotide--dimethylbenzimidazole phosphoribosyltransferase